MSLDSSYPQVELPFLPPNTIVPPPSEEDTYIQYFNRLYEDVAFAVNSKDPTFFQIPISATASDIPNIPNFGAYIVCISGTLSTLPSGTWALAKSDSSAAGVIAVLQTQAGTGTWAAVNLTITSTASNFQIAHNLANTTANFNIRIIGTQR